MTNYGGDIYSASYAELRQESRNKTMLIVALLGVIAISISLNVIQWNYLPEPKVVSEDCDGRIRPLPTLDEPMFPESKVLSWSADKFELLYDLPFTELATYRTKLGQFMMPNSANDFVDGMKAAGIIKKVKDERKILRAIRSAPPALINQFTKDGRYIWQVEMPLTLIYEGTGQGSNPEYQNVIVRGFVGREHLLKSKDGLVIGSVEIYPGRQGGMR